MNLSDATIGQLLIPVDDFDRGRTPGRASQRFVTTTTRTGPKMAKLHGVTFPLMTALAFGVSALAPSVAMADTASDVVGTWTLVSSVTERDGTKTDQFGVGAKGMLILDASGRFMLTIIGPDLPKFASNNRAGGTAEENKAVVSKSIAMIGSYSVSPADRTLTFRVDSATFPNWNGSEQKRLLAPTGSDELKYVTPTASSGGVGTVTWKRVK
jgi:hypothetical protein